MRKRRTALLLPLLLGAVAAVNAVNAVNAVDAVDAVNAESTAADGANGTSFIFSNVYGDGMVLQSAPKRAIVWGLCTSGDSVTVAFGSVLLNATVALYGGNWTWSVFLPPTAASFAGHNVTATSAQAGRSITLANVLFGDVWICSGQSNMVLGMKQINNSGAELAAQAAYPYIREFILSGGSDAPQILAATIVAPWRSPNGSELDSHLSAMCWLYARDMYVALDPPRPLGTIVAAQLGTPDEPFSSPDALAKCEDPTQPYPKGSSDLWNGMVVPLLNTTIYGVVWYQGEGNVKNPGGRYGGYNCTFPAMVADWRAKWSVGTAGATDPQFPFGFVQLNGYGGGTRGGPFVPKYNNPVDTDYSNVYSTRWGFAAIRWAQTAGYGYVPNPVMPKTFMAVILDTANPSGGVHSPFKQPAAARLARAALKCAYGVNTGTLAPRVGSVKRSGNDTVVVTLTDLGTAVEVHNTTGFEAMVVSPQNASQAMWVSTPVVGFDNTSVALGSFPAGATRLRYLWYQDACGLEAYGCAVYTTVPAIGNLSGELTFLPLAPFIMDL